MNFSVNQLPIGLTYSIISPFCSSLIILMYFLVGDAALLDAAKKGNLTRVWFGESCFTDFIQIIVHCIVVISVYNY